MQPVDVLLDGGLVVMRTDTLYGVLARADDPIAVERVYTVRRRPLDKQMIVLISDTGDIWDQGPLIDQLERLSGFWPGPTSVILPAGDPTPAWILRGGHSVAFRMPDDDQLRDIIRQTGPLVAPSANIAGEPPATNIDMAKQYFDDMIDLYVDGGDASDATPSRLLRVELDGSVTRLR